MKTIKVEIPADGKPPVISVDGAVGSECTDLTKNLTRALGVVESQEKKPEFFQHAGQSREVKRG